MKKIALLLLAFFTASYGSYKTKVFSIRTVQDFLQGKGENVAYLRDGGITFAPASEKVFDSPEAFLWSIERDKKGNFFLGTGQRGVLFITDAHLKVQKQVLLPEVNITTMVSHAHGVYVAGFPSGKIFSVGSDGKEREIAQIEARYIWQLLLERDHLYALTGEPACLFQVLPEQKKIFCGSMAHFLSGIKKGETFFIGTGSPATLLEVSQKGKALVREIFEGEDLYAMVMKGDVLYVAVNGQQALSNKPVSSDQPQKEKRRVLEEKHENASFSKTIFPAQGQKAAISAKVYRIQEGKLPEVLLDVGDPLIASLALDKDVLYIGTGNEGWLYLYDLAQEKVQSFPLESRQILALKAIGNHLLALTGNPAALYRIALQEASQELAYESKVLDGGGASWPGAGEYKGLSSAVLKVRAGNTSQPDETWTDWLSLNELPVKPFRFFQLRLTAQRKEKEPGSITAIFFSYRPLNRPPQILSLDLQVLRTRADAGKSTGNPGNTLFSSRRRLVIKAEDRDEDPLLFDIFLEREDGKTMLLKRSHNQSFYDLDFKKFPEGRYRLKVEARDSLQNARGEALKDSLSTRFFDVDLTPPKITFSQQGKKRVIVAKENLSYVESARVIIGRQSSILFPQDLLFDEKEEVFEIPEEIREPFFFQTRDANGNVSVMWVENSK